MYTKDLLKNPIIKIIGIIAVLYFAVFSNKRSPDSPGNRFSSENIKKNLGEMKEKGQFISTNIANAKAELKRKKEQADQTKQITNSPTTDQQQSSPKQQ